MKLLDTNRNSEKSICCPFCITRIGKHDTKFHLGINLIKGVYHCLRCDASGHISKLKGLPFNIEQEKEIKGISDILNIVNPPLKKRELNYSEFTQPFSSNTPLAISYIAERGYDYKILIKKYNLTVGKKYEKNNYTISKWEGRIIFPFIKDNMVVYAVGRSYVNKEPKYLNAKSDREGLLFNINRVNGDAILCEGVFSAIAAEMYSGVPAVAALGKYVTSSQLISLRLVCDNLWICLDGDVLKSTIINTINSALQLGFKIKLISLPNNPDQKDPDVLKEKFIEYLNSAINIKSKLDLWDKRN